MDINSVSSIRIQNAYFNQSETLQLFNKGKKTIQICLLYGKNGSGKTTISRAFQKIAGKEISQIDSADLLDNRGVSISTDQSSLPIHVFNEDFIHENFEFQANSGSDGLETIVVIGEIKQIEDEIKKLLPAYYDAKNMAAKSADELTKYNDDKNPLSPDFYRNRIFDTLKGKNKNECWASRDKKINGRSRNTNVRQEDDFIESIVQYHNDEISRDTAIEEFNHLIDQQTKINSGENQIIITIETPVFNPTVEKKARELLQMKIEKPVINDREKRMIEIIEKKGREQLFEVKQFFSDPSHKVCPYCQQPVTQEYSKELIKSIEKILSEEVEKHIEQLQHLITEEVKIDLSPLDSLAEFNEYCLSVNNAVNVLNSAIFQMNRLLEKKTRDVFSPISMPDLNMMSLYQKLKDACDSLSEAINEYNEKASETKEIIEKLKKYNLIISAFDIYPDYQQYKRQSKEKEKAVDQKKKDREYFLTLDLEMKRLEAKEKGIAIAKDAINDDLRYIFSQMKDCFYRRKTINMYYILIIVR